ncbi:MAG TPA: hypothetical protein PLX14_14060, partial [Anaerolineales bacterium]|nr:hypothetical protein [Anaerolineales bacterium]
NAFSPTIFTRMFCRHCSNAVIEVMAQDKGWDETLPEDHVQYVLPAMVELILMSPEFQWK